mmetsp:Transcript_68198/g.142509  ORF Transcript_68198/g.142509 Transcript_68198/m.142509 type:complete len:210 (+) Transcript_68198:662-1291(+)
MVCRTSFYYPHQFCGRDPAVCPDVGGSHPGPDLCEDFCHRHHRHRHDPCPDRDPGRAGRRDRCASGLGGGHHRPSRRGLGGCGHRDGDCGAHDRGRDRRPYPVLDLVPDLDPDLVHDLDFFLGRDRRCCGAPPGSCASCCLPLPVSCALSPPLRECGFPSRPALQPPRASPVPTGVPFGRWQGRPAIFGACSLQPSRPWKLSSSAPLLR